ncbi:tetratricopeptide repeat protein [Microcystis aeruginosa LEGE 00239]|uniref:tetratricopeptide repeat protein n=1 Tax=Microcystis aeruginosa TaxID=1126 RepID=UPI00187ECA6B|nr:tetratricopeptide repeat protein [Microcystis aeruginosa]MBE9245257.1 tetratricopeptide repeat protein [Microcystis aeruginosa LEGE 00239]
MADYNQATNIKPDYADAYNNRGSAKYELGDKQGAIADYNQAIKIKPDYADAYINRGNAKSNLGDKQGVIADYNQAAQLYSQQDNMEMYLKALDNIKNLEK